MTDHSINPPCPGDWRRSGFLKTDAIAQTLAELIRINSVNPSYGGPEGGEDRLGRWIADFLAGRGLHAHPHAVAPGRNNLVVTLPGRTERPGMLFETHLDTVSIEDMSVAPLGARIHAGRIFGRGATDAKAQIAALLHALAALAETGPPSRPVHVAFVVDEEFAMAGSAALASQLDFEPAGIAVAEPTNLNVVTTHKGTVRWWIDFRGRAAHSSRPHLGVNAIAGAARLIHKIEESYTTELAARTAPLLDPPTLNVARIQGGVQANLVPPSCRVELERRTIPGETPESVQGEVQHLIAGVLNEMPELNIEQQRPSFAASALCTDAESAPARTALRIAARIGRSEQPLGVAYATDAAQLVRMGRPIIVVGPGSIEQAHTADEFAELEEVTAGARYFAEFMATFGGES